MPGPIIACVGGFLGAGKTTALTAAARDLASRGKRVGIIVNDQGSRLVDMAFLGDVGLPVEEVTGGCFCCRFDDLVDNAERILDTARPDVIFAEAVGSCTDLSATVLQPLRRYYADRFDLAPLTVFVEPSRLRDYWRGISEFPGAVSYLFEKQLAEADLIVLNKIDLVDPGECEALIRFLEERFDGVAVQPISALSGSHVGDWVDRLFGAEGVGDRVQDVDYEIYAEAEASLGWLNATVEITSSNEIHPRAFGEELLETVQRGSADAGAAIAHLKVLVATEAGSDRASVTDSYGSSQWSGGADLAPARELSVIVNARVRMSPEPLEQLVRTSIATVAGGANASARVQHLECFSPEPPRPVHRLAGAASESRSTGAARRERDV